MLPLTVQRLAGFGIISAGVAVKNEVLTYQSEADLDVKIFFGKTNHLLYSKLRNAAHAY